MDGGAGMNKRWGMAVDLNRCVGCQTCTIACKHANDTPPGVQWRRVVDVELGTFPDVQRLFLLTGCQHCADPSCVPVCPTGATRQRADGLVTMDYDLCIGCGYCIVACPYQARSIAHDQRWYFDSPSTQERQVSDPERLGVATKCTFCIGRLDDAATLGLEPGLDPEVTPACAASCIASAIHFGDFGDPGSTVSRMTRENNFFQMHQSLGNDPQLRYLYDGPDGGPGRDGESAEADDDSRADPANALVGAPQTVWDFRAAMNFSLGGMSSGLAVVAGLAHASGFLTAEALLMLYVAAAIGMAIGLTFVFFEIGRKHRFLNVLRRPHTSWMTRETYVVAAMYPTLLVDLLWPSGLMHGLFALEAAAFLLCQAMILPTGKGIPAWRAPLMPWMLGATGLLEGAGLLAVGAALSAAMAGAADFAASAGLGLGAVSGVLWFAYRKGARRCGIAVLARRELDRINALMHLGGHVAPILLFAAFLGIEPRMPILLALGGAAAVAGGVLWKFTVITRACHQQGFALPNLPRRGAGTRAAPARLGGMGPAALRST